MRVTDVYVNSTPVLAASTVVTQDRGRGARATVPRISLYLCHGLGPGFEDRFPRSWDPGSAVFGQGKAEGAWNPTGREHRSQSLSDLGGLLVIRKPATLAVRCRNRFSCPPRYRAQPEVTVERMRRSCRMTSVTSSGRAQPAHKNVRARS